MDTTSCNERFRSEVYAVNHVLQQRELRAFERFATSADACLEDFRWDSSCSSEDLPSNTIKVPSHSTKIRNHKTQPISKKSNLNGFGGV